MPAVSAARPLDHFSREDWARLTRVSRWRGLAMVFHAWAVVALAAALAVWSGQWWAWLLAIVVIGGRQLGIAILMHEAAHGLLHPDRRLNNFLGQWVTGAAVGADLKAYRSYHLTHHRFTQQPEDPDLPLSAPFPTSRASMARKVLRDLSGLTFLKQRGAQLAMAVGAGLGRGGAGANVFVARAFARFLAVQAMLLALSLASGLGPWPFLIWLIALATTFPLFLRIRNIAEHGCTATGSGDPFSHARTTHAGWIERATVAPYWVNFHSEHHLFMGIPAYRLAEAHRLLVAGGNTARMTIAPGYWSVLRQATAR